MSAAWLLLLLPVAALSGYFAARRRYSSSNEDRVARVSRSYFRGLSLLLDEQTDAAIQAFLEVEDPDADTFETQLALGSLFRRRGEVDRAIRLHLALFERSGLSAEQRSQALFELGEDYMRAGLLDRAEALYNDLIQIGVQPERALKAMLSIYEQEKDWQGAIDSAQRLEVATNESFRVRIAHYHCELAERHAALEPAQALSHIQTALATDAKCARARVIDARLALDAGETLRALEAMVKAAEAEGAVAPELLPLWRRAYEDTELRQAARASLQRLVELDPGVHAFLTQTEIMAEEQGLAQAESVLADALSEKPSMPVLQRLLKLDAKRQDHSALLSKLSVASDVIQRAIDRHPGYRCQRCGFGARTLHWQCPSCKSWSSVKPVQGG